jgi:hypothetical protein
MRIGRRVSPGKSVKIWTGKVDRIGIAGSMRPDGRGCRIERMIPVAAAVLS